MDKQYNVEEVLDLVFNDDSHKVFWRDSVDELGLEDDDDKCILATDVTIDDTIVNTRTDFKTGTEPATTLSFPAGDVDLSSTSTPAA
uniref:Uncharacterized protein n=1 Tax=Amphimedon queenslandica TaxID=400682 RepID=A0A1X7VA63_AMPQE